MTSKILPPIISAVALGVVLLIPVRQAQAASLSLGADYLLRGVSITPPDKTINKDQYYDQRLEAYMTTDLSKEVEASVRIQSITPWGLEGSTNPLQTRYPNANGTPWVQNAYARMPSFLNNHLILTIGRQPLQWGDGVILSDDDLGMNAVRAQIKSPFRFLPFDLDGFTAKITETLTENKDTDLNGVLLGVDRDVMRWEFMSLWESTKGQQLYELGSSSNTFGVSKIQRQIYGARVKTSLKDAYIKGEVYLQSGKVTPSDIGAQEIKLGGTAYMFSLGGKSNVRYFGRFGAVLDYSFSDGDNGDTPNKDEAFRATYSSRWSGLERKGWGKYLAANLSDVYSPSNPFGPVNSVNTGLAPGTSGLQNIHFGVESTPWAEWTFSLDYVQSNAQRNLTGQKDIGTELDYGITYRYSGLVTFRAVYASFSPGDAAVTSDLKQKANFTSAEAEVKF